MEQNPDFSTTCQVRRSDLPSGPMPLPADLETLVRHLAGEMAQAWRRGWRVPAEDFLDRCPQLWSKEAAVLDLVHEEIRLRREFGSHLNLADFGRRFPAWKHQIAVLLRCEQTLVGDSASWMPDVGETVGDFRLISVLGRGGQGSVFLAAQTSLGDRPVVVKITPQTGVEHLSLARLQHTHIVPLLSSMDDKDRELRILCMPYYGGATLSAFLDSLEDRPLAERTGQHLKVFLERSQPPGVKFSTPRSPAGAFLARASYVQAIAWIGACLAEALKYAHDRGLVHLDLKPSNILLTAECQPMLLDFHLASPPLRAADVGTHFGGTAMYMSPEQRRTMMALREQKPAAETVDGRSDIYSLGRVLHEALTGSVEFDGTPAPLRKLNPQVSQGLFDIVAKCLAADPSRRYADAGDLAADLWRHLSDKPLRGVPNRSRSEAWQKWRRRQPQALALWGLAAVVVLIAMFAGFLLRNRTDSPGEAERFQREQAIRELREMGDRILRERSALAGVGRRE